MALFHQFFSTTRKLWTPWDENTRLACRSHLVMLCRNTSKALGCKASHFGIMLSKSSGPPCPQPLVCVKSLSRLPLHTQSLSLQGMGPDCCSAKNAVQASAPLIQCHMTCVAVLKPADTLAHIRREAILSLTGWLLLYTEPPLCSCVPAAQAQQ